MLPDKIDKNKISVPAFMHELFNLLFKYSAEIKGKNGIDIEIGKWRLIWRGNEINETNCFGDNYETIRIDNPKND